MQKRIGTRLLPPTAAPQGATGTPSRASLAIALALDELLERLVSFAPRVHVEMEQVVGLQLGQLRVLAAVRAGASHLDDIAAATGEHPAAVAASVEQLADQLLLVVGAVGSEWDVALTERGRTVLDQLAAVRLRVLADLPERSGQRLLAAVDELLQRLDELVGPPNAPRVLPA